MLFPSAKILLRDPKDINTILLIKRTINGHLVYEPAGGKIEVDFKNRTAESLEECALREAKEELGVTATINQYIGSYHCFWDLDPMRFSSCAVFIGDIISTDNQFTTNADSCELLIEPIWVTVKEILEKKITFDPRYNGLQEIVINHFKK